MNFFKNLINSHLYLKPLSEKEIKKQEEQQAFMEQYWPQFCSKDGSSKRNKKKTFIFKTTPKAISYIPNRKEVLDDLFDYEVQNIYKYHSKKKKK